LFEKHWITEILILRVNSFDELTSLETKGGFVLGWNCSYRRERSKDLTKATIRCIPLDSAEEAGSCVFTGEKISWSGVVCKAY
jgi:prolyl-tRNA synthetase